jgi:hypothetical protein
VKSVILTTYMNVSTMYVWPTTYKHEKRKIAYRMIIRMYIWEKNLCIINFIAIDSLENRFYFRPFPIFYLHKTLSVRVV